MLWYLGRKVLVVDKTGVLTRVDRKVGLAVAGGSWPFRNGIERSTTWWGNVVVVFKEMSSGKREWYSLRSIALAKVDVTVGLAVGGEKRAFRQYDREVEVSNGNGMV
jgi:hypothetical protein